MKKNLVDYVGRNYFADRFKGCMFYDPQGRPAYIDNNRQWPRGAVSVNIVEGTADSYKVTETSLPHEFFKDMQILATPPLGWRMAGKGKYMVHLRRSNVGNRNGYQRGLNTRILEKTLSPVTEFMLDTDNLSEDPYVTEPAIVSMVMNPEYHRLKDGLELLREGELLSFCVNPNIAVIPDVNDNVAVLFNTKKVATINQKNHVKAASAVVSTIIGEHL